MPKYPIFLIDSLIAGSSAEVKAESPEEIGDGTGEDKREKNKEDVRDVEKEEKNEKRDENFSSYGEKRRRNSSSSALTATFERISEDENARLKAILNAK